MSEVGKQTEQTLLETGRLVPFRIVDKHTELSPDKENVFVRVDLVFEGDDEDTESDEIVDWAAFGFIFTLAELSFHDARPRGISDVDFLPNDTFVVDDFLRCLTFGKVGLLLSTDYIRGRSMKTDVTIRTDGSVTQTTWGKGQSALRWLDQLQGEKRISVVPVANSN